MSNAIPRKPGGRWARLVEVLVVMAITVSVTFLTRDILEWRTAASAEGHELQTAILAGIIWLEQESAAVKAFPVMSDTGIEGDGQAVQKRSDDLTFQLRFLQLHQKITRDSSDQAAAEIAEATFASARANGIRALIVLGAIAILFSAAMYRLYLLTKARKRIAELEQALADRGAQG
jgi:hypothetical protein